MEINKVSSVSFGAHKILTSTKKFKNGVDKTVEVFLLKRGEDDSFVNTCLDVLDKNKKSLNPKELRLKQMFEDFGKYRYYDYLVAIKDGEQIVGATQNNRSCEGGGCWMKDLITLTEHKQVERSLWKGIISESKKYAHDYITWFTGKKDVFYDIEKNEGDINLSSPKNEHIQFHKFDKQNKTNLLDYLDIDFQDRVI